MSIKLHYAGILVECDTTAQAVEILSALASNGVGAAKSEAVSIVAFIRKLGDRPKRALAVIADTGGKATDTALREKLGLDPPGLGGLMAGISKEAVRTKFKLETILKSEVTVNGDKRVRVYSIPSEALEEVRKGLAAG